MLDKGAVGAESSWAGGGILSPLCPWDYPEQVTRLTELGRKRYADSMGELYESSGIDPEFETGGMLVLPPFDLHVAMKWCETHQVECVEQHGGLFLPEVAHVRNPRLVQALRKRVEMLGGRILEGCEALGFEVRSGKISRLMASGGALQADQYIVTAGAWSKQVLGEYALNLEIKPIRGQMLLFKFDAPPIKHILLQDGMYLIPRRDGHLLVGSTLEDVGSDKQVTEEAKLSLWQHAQILLPALRDMRPVRHWSGLRPGSPGNVPVMCRHPHLENLYINSGHFRYGVTMAPASADIMLNLLEGWQQPFDISEYRLI